MSFYTKLKQFMCLRKIISYYLYIGFITLNYALQKKAEKCQKNLFYYYFLKVVFQELPSFIIFVVWIFFIKIAFNFFLT